TWRFDRNHPFFTEPTLDDRTQPYLQAFQPSHVADVHQCHEEEKKLQLKIGCIGTD
ncbi:hypothetical protein GBA52_004565, partial [Prunus armeniaca]